MPIIVTIHAIQTIHAVIPNIPYPTDLHTTPTIHTIANIHAIHTIPTIHTKHTILSKHAIIPDRPYTPYIPNIPYHTPTTPQGGRGKISIWDPSHGGGMWGGGRAWCIYISICIYIYVWRTKLFVPRNCHGRNWVVPYRLWRFSLFDNIQ